MKPSADPRRRRLLKLGLGGALAVAAGGTALRWLAGGYGSQLAPGDTPIALSPKEFAVVKAFVDALIPASGAFPSGVALGVHQRIDEEMWSAAAPMRGDMKNGLQLLEHATLLDGFGSRFTALGAEARLAYIEALLRARPGALQQVAFALKEMAYLFYYARTETWKGIGYDGPFVAIPKPPDSRAAYQALVRQGSAS
ncbi:MAG: gluconate 2-dehydrogenase subunit 3 family protein [Gemmatimonadetes bacterium]|nr:gluconate 2-dehydrogenase subunit 3 family protein [Gemmatimonadota bacterium]